MWPLTDGLRCLSGPEASLFRGVVGMMVDQLVFELNTDRLNRDPIEGCVDSQDRAATRPFSTGDQGRGDAGDEDASDPFDYPDLLSFGFETPHWYSMWEPEQRVWLLERVTTSVLTARTPPPSSAIFEATLESVYVELADLIAIEITNGTPIEKGSWRGSLLDAYVQRCPQDSLLGALQFEATTLDPCLPPNLQHQIKRLIDQEPEEPPQTHRNVGKKQPQSRDKDPSINLPGEPDWMTWWTSVIERLVDATYGPRIYHSAEQYRDGDPQRLTHFLRSKGVNHKFLQRIPPLRSRGQTQAAIDRLQAIIFQTP